MKCTCQRRGLSLKRTLRKYVKTAASSQVTSLTAVRQEYWKWKGHKIRYQNSGEKGPPVVLVHGFGANCDHWRKNIPVLGQEHRTYAIDLLGYGYSDKPNPREAAPSSLYTFENWGSQLVDFIDEVVQEPSFIICNSVGGMSGLEASLQRPELVRGVQLINISLRGLNVKRQAPWQRPLVAALQRVLRETPAGRAFFANLATPTTVSSVLKQAYYDKSTVTDELVSFILDPGLQPGAVDVFLDFISYSGGPLPEELLEKVTCPVSMLWGAKDPWEDVRLGKQLLSIYPCVEEFVELPNIGHCPQDEAPQVVNPLIRAFVARHAAVVQAAVQGI